MGGGGHTDPDRYENYASIFKIRPTLKFYWALASWFYLSYTLILVCSPWYVHFKTTTRFFLQTSVKKE